MRIAVQGCCHGELDRIYASLQFIQQSRSTAIDLLVICGDFQAMRNEADVRDMACPEKYRALGTFHAYYSGARLAPIPTVFIGGNHEASGYLWELYHGGWVCPNIYFLGFGGCINFGSLRIAGLSGIYKSGDYETGHYERAPYNAHDSHSVYHVRKFNVYRAAQIRDPLDVFLSHDWPNNIALHGNTRQLLSIKRHFRAEVESHSLGSPPNEMLLRRLKPSYWFAAHMHVKFAALVHHQSSPHPQQTLADGSAAPAAGPVANPDEITIDDDLDDEADSKGDKAAPAETSDSQPLPQHTAEHQEATAAAPPTNARRVHAQATRFLSLDKCLPGRDFLQVLEIPTIDEPGRQNKFYYDEEWLAIVRATHSLFSASRYQKPLIPDDEIQHRIDQERAWVRQNITSKGTPDDPFGGLAVPENFVTTARPHDPDYQERGGTYLNPQTVQFCNMLQIPNMINPHGLSPVPLSTAAEAAVEAGSLAGPRGADVVLNDDAIVVSDDDLDGADLGDDEEQEFVQESVQIGPVQ
ncbi:lariat debranching enzyme, C-terminal domain-containing protein [Entophlyctis helioformis]|nr:lariat debranching enzyme, C-terminal domain-containing protein [Entophlyctis helioformis]